MNEEDDLIDLNLDEQLVHMPNLQVLIIPGRPQSISSLEGVENSSILTDRDTLDFIKQSRCPSLIKAELVAGERWVFRRGQWVAEAGY